MPPSPRLLPDPALRASCTRILSGHGRQDAREWLARMAQSDALDEAIDVYSEGPAMSRLEQDTAALLGKEAALFFHKGIVAQQAALLIHATNTSRRVVALHPKSHLALDEHDAVDRLCNLVSRRVGPDRAPFDLADLQKVAEPLAAVTVEIPLRRAAFQATPWDELVAMSQWARERAIPFHLDAARIWEVQPWYNRSLADISALADTIYVSFYKGLGGMGGCVLAGPADFIAAARPWRNRFGGDLPTIFPYVITALDGLNRHLPRMADYHAHAKAIAAAIEAVPGLTAFPGIPHGNSFQVHFDAPLEPLEKAAIDIARNDKKWLFNRLEPATLPNQTYGEIAVGENALTWLPADIAATLGQLLQSGRG